MPAATAFPDYLQQSYDMTSQVRDNGGFAHWNDAWSNFVVNHALSEYEFSRNKEMWELMNEYNSPANQMARFKEAGLNPNLVYTQGNPGNASSPASYKAPNITFEPQKASTERMMNKINGAMQIIGTLNNVAQNIAGMYEAGLDVQLKQNQVYRSNFDTAVMRYAYPGYGYSKTDIGPYQTLNVQEQLNPLSQSFDPVMYLAYSRSGQLPSFFNQFSTGNEYRELLDLRQKYQDYYNKNLLPKFDAYQQGKIDVQELNKSMQDYENNARQITPAWLRGILDPLFGYLMPILKNAFK